MEISKEYLRQIDKYPLLTLEEELELAKKIKSGNKIAFNRLVNSNLRLVISIAKKMQTASCDIMDLIQEGTLGLMTAAEKFDEQFNNRFSTYAYQWIVQYMMRYISRKKCLISLPSRKGIMINRIEKVQNDFFCQNGREASISELALLLGISEEKVKKCLEYSYAIASLDVEVGNKRNSTTMGDLLPDLNLTPEEKLIKEDSISCIRNLLDSLQGNEKYVLWQRYNFDHCKKGKTLREISATIGITPEAVRQTEIRAIKRLKSAMKENLSVI